MDERARLAERFEEHRPHLRAVAYRMLGSLAEADDAVQEAWVRLDRSDTADIENLEGWLTTVVSRMCLDVLRSRRVRREELMGAHVPDPIVDREGEIAPEHEALLADSVGLALLVVLDTLTPAERLAFVLHDTFGMPFREIAPMLGRTPATTRKLASRARRRVRGVPHPDEDLGSQREVVGAFLTASREGDFGALLDLLDPDAVLRADTGVTLAGAPKEVRGARAVAGQALAFVERAPFARAALVNGAAGLVVAPGGRPVAVMGFTVSGGRIAEIDILADPSRLGRIDMASLDE